MKRIHINFLILLCIALLPQPFFLICENIFFKEILQVLSFLCILYLPYLIFSNLQFRKIYYFLFIFLLSANTIVEVLYVLLNRTTINGTGLKIFFESNKSELLGYALENIPISGYVFFALLLILFFKLIFSIKHNTEIYGLKKTLYLINLFCIPFYVWNTCQLSENRYGPFLNIHNAYSETKSYYTELRNMQKNKTAILENRTYTCDTTKPKIYVIIIGESTSRKHMQLYGYKRNTSPFLSKRNDLQLFTDVISSRANTLSSLSEALTFDDSCKHKHDFTCISILDVCNKAGIETYWLSNQAPMGFWDNSIALTARNAKHTTFTTSETNAQLPTSRNYDALLIPLLQETIKNISKKSLIVIHLMGAHSPYYKRYPKEFSIFNDTSNFNYYYPFAKLKQRKETINEYDNAIYYNDSVVNELLTIIKQKTEQDNIDGSAIYFSDHGEELYDVSSRLGHDEGYKSDIQHEIPFILWNASKNKSDTTNTNKPIILNNFIQSLTHWMGIQGTGIDTTQSMFYKNYKNIPRIIYNRPYKKTMWCN